MPFKIADLALNVTVSTGISLYPDHGVSRDGLLKHANHASHLAKAAASGGYLFFSTEMNRGRSGTVKTGGGIKTGYRQ